MGKTVDANLQGHGEVLRIEHRYFWGTRALAEMLNALGLWFRLSRLVLPIVIGGVKDTANRKQHHETQMYVLQSMTFVAG